MKLLKRMYFDELVKRVNAIKTTDTSDLVKKLTTIQKVVKLKRKYLIMIIIISILLLIDTNRLTAEKLAVR